MSYYSAQAQDSNLHPLESFPERFPQAQDQMNQSANPNQQPSSELGFAQKHMQQALNLCDQRLKAVINESLSLEIDDRQVEVLLSLLHDIEKISERFAKPDDASLNPQLNFAKALERDVRLLVITRSKESLTKPIDDQLAILAEHTSEFDRTEMKQASLTELSRNTLKPEGVNTTQKFDRPTSNSERVSNNQEFMHKYLNLQEEETWNIEQVQQSVEIVGRNLQILMSNPQNVSSVWQLLNPDSQWKSEHTNPTFEDIAKLFLIKFSQLSFPNSQDLSQINADTILHVEVDLNSDNIPWGLSLLVEYIALGPELRNIHTSNRDYSQEQFKANTAYNVNVSVIEKRAGQIAV
jgi:hypothetical protein